MYVTGRTARLFSCPEWFLPEGATRCTDKHEIWYGEADGSYPRDKWITHLSVQKVKKLEFCL